VLRKLYGHRLPLFLGVLIFTLSGVLHPLFHMNIGGGERHSAVFGKTVPAHGTQHDARHHGHHGFCPVCAGLFSSAEVPELPPAPAVADTPADYAEIATIVRLPEFILSQQVRGPPVLS